MEVTCVAIKSGERCGCASFARWATSGMYQVCECGHSENCHLSTDSAYLTGLTKKSKR